LSAWVWRSYINCAVESDVLTKKVTAFCYTKNLYHAWQANDWPFYAVPRMGLSSHKKIYCCVDRVMCWECSKQVFYNCVSLISYAIIIRSEEHTSELQS